MNSTLPTPSDTSQPPAEPDPNQEETLTLSKWLVPFFVIPAVIVVAVGLIFLLFGMLTASELTPRENLNRVLHGGRNDRKQGAFELQRQLQNLEQEHQNLDASFVPDLMKAYAATLQPDSDLVLRCYLISLFGLLKDSRTIPLLKEAMHDPAQSDESGVILSVRFLAAQALANFATPEALSDFPVLLKDKSDKGLRILAAGALANLGDAQTQALLRETLSDPEAEVRWTAALSLARHLDSSATPVLREVIDPKSSAVWKNFDARFEATRAAIEGLVALRDRESIALLKEIDLKEGNPKIRDLAKKGIEKLNAIK